MARISKRKRLARRLKKEVKARREKALKRLLLDVSDASEDEIDEHVELHYEQVLSSRYTFRPNKYRKRADKWKQYLHDQAELTEEEFIGYFRVSRPAFDAILELIQDDPVFKPSGRRAFRGGPELHLLILLKYLGSFGNDNSAPKLVFFFGLGKGSIKNYLNRATSAMLKLKDTTMTWPDEDERKQIATRIHQRYGFVNCVGMIDGTLLPLEVKPFKNGEDYYSRKGGYSLNALIMCDDVARVRDAVVGWPGCVHDNRVWSNSRVCHEPGQFFDHNQYLLGDSAFRPSPTMVPTFKKPPKSELDRQRKYFNTRLAKVRIKTEHCIGLLKTRFQFLRGIRIKLRRKASMRRLLRLTTCGFILHNLLIADPIPEDWKPDIKKYGKPLDDDDELNQPISRVGGGTERRSQLFHYLLEVRR